jgi:hypothetical protein
MIWLAVAAGRLFWKLMIDANLIPSEEPAHTGSACFSSSRAARNAKPAHCSKPHPHVRP